MSAADQIAFRPIPPRSPGAPSVGRRSQPTDLVSRTAVHSLVVGFYRELALDDLLGPVFIEVAEVDWATHIPLLIDYWCRILLGQEGYQGAILAAHRDVHMRQALTAAHFDRWYRLWVQTIDAQWSGPLATKAKRHAAKIGATLAKRVTDLAWMPPAVGDQIVASL